MDNSTHSALLLIDIQPEWYSQSHISKLFPKMPENVSNLLKTCRQAPNNEVIHVRAQYSETNDDF